MYYIGYILGVILIIWIVSKIFSAIFGKKDTGAAAGSSVSSAEKEETESREDEEKTASEAESAPGSGLRHDTEKPSETAKTGEHIRSGSKRDGTGTPEEKGKVPKRDSEGAAMTFIKPPSEADLPETEPGVKGTGASGEKVPPAEREPRKAGTPGPSVRSGGEESEDGEKKTVILYREDTGRYRKRCPYCNTYMTNGDVFCEVCGSRVSA